MTYMRVDYCCHLLIDQLTDPLFINALSLKKEVHVLLKLPD